MTAQELHDKLKSGGAHFYHKNVLVAREKSQEVSKGGIIIAESAQRRQQFGAVVAFGDRSAFAPGGKRDGELQIGDSVYISSYGGVVLKQKVDGEVYVLEALSDRDIMLSYRGKSDVELESGGSQATGA